MNAITVVSGGPARPRKKHSRCAGSRWRGGARVFPFQLADPGRIRGRGPGRLPESIWARFTHPRSVSLLIPSSSPMRLARRRSVARLFLDVEHEADRPLPQLIPDTSVVLA